MDEITIKTPKIVVYTCVTGGYDHLRRYRPPVRTDIDFVCFTDDMDMEPNGWSLRPIPDDLKNIPRKKIQRIIKICPHRYLPDYDISVWIDGNIQIICDIGTFLEPFISSEQVFFTSKHPTRRCIYDEAIAVIKMRRGDPLEIKAQIDKYIKEGFPRHLGLIESGIMIRRHNNPRCKLLDNMWAMEILNGSHRDQLSFNYCLWKLGMHIGYIDIPKITRKNAYFKWSRHG